MFINVIVPQSRLLWEKLNSRKNKFLFLVKSASQLKCATILFVYLWGASLVAQLVKNPPTMQETQVQSLGWKDPLEEEMATYSSTLA